MEDLGSKNGLALNGRRLRGERALVPGDEIALGGTTLAYSDPLAGADRASPGEQPAPAAWPDPGAPGRWLAAAALLLLCAAALALAS